MANLSKLQARAQLLAQQKKIKLSVEEEIRAIRIKRLLHSAYTMYLSSVISNFLKSRNKENFFSRKIDAYKSLNIMSEEFDKNPNFFPVFMRDTKRILETALLGRNSVIHSFLPLLLLDGGTYLLSWISVCHLIAEPVAADQLRKIYNQIYAGIQAPLRHHSEINYSIPEFVEPIARPGNMSIKDFEKSLVIIIKMFTAMTETLCPAIRSFFVSQPGGQAYDNSVMDSKSYLEDLIKLWERNPSSTSNDDDIKVLKKAQLARNSLCHGNLFPLLNRYNEFLESWIEVCSIVGKPEVGGRILVVKKQLNAL